MSTCQINTDINTNTDTFTKYQKTYRVFGKKKVFLPVVHIVTIPQTIQNVEILVRNNVQGCWIINHSCTDEVFYKAFNYIKTNHPSMWVGINYLHGNPVTFAFKFCNKFSIRPDGFWFDNLGVVDNDVTIAQVIAHHIKANNFEQALIFGSICFKYQQQPKDVALTTTNAMNFTDIITTSGKGTGHEHVAADLAKFQLMKEVCRGQNYLAVASGISETNIANIIDTVDIFMVNSSITHNEIFVEEKLAKLKAIIDSY